jgi:hypothetical protein
VGTGKGKGRGMNGNTVRENFNEFNLVINEID